MLHNLIKLALIRKEWHFDKSAMTWRGQTRRYAQSQSILKTPLKYPKARDIVKSPSTTDRQLPRTRCFRQRKGKKSSIIFARQFNLMCREIPSELGLIQSLLWGMPQRRRNRLVSSLMCTDTQRTGSWLTRDSRYQLWINALLVRMKEIIWQVSTLPILALADRFWHLSLTCESGNTSSDC